MKILQGLIAVIFVFSLLVTFIHVTGEKNPAYQFHETTWAGQLALGQLHRNGDYSFYSIHKDAGGRITMVRLIATFPAAEAAHLH